MLRVMAWLCLVPILYVGAFFLYAEIGSDAGCGSQDPGLCFGAGMLLMVMMPLSGVTTALAAILFITDARRRRARRDDRG